MSFNTFLTLNEGEPSNKASLILQAFIDNIASAHYKQDDQTIRYNIGKTIKISRYSDLELVIRSSRSEDIRLGKAKNGKYAIVIDTPNIPNIHQLEEFLENKKRMNKIAKEIGRFLESKSDRGESYDVNKMTNYEKNKYYNSKENFEFIYQKLVTNLNNKLEKLENMLSNFKKQMEKTDNPSRKITLEMAMEKLKNEYIGKSERDFINMANKLLDDIEPNFRNNLDKENKTILEDRLKQFYEEIN